MTRKAHLLIILILAGCSAAELVDQCNEFCSQQIVTDESDDFDLVCNKTCKLNECKIGCQKWFTFSNLLNCPQICERKKSGQPTESIYCNIGCNQALKLYVNKTRSSLGVPSAPYLVGDSLRNDSLVLQWKTSTLDFNMSYLVQFKYSQLNSEWIYFRPNSPVKSGQLQISNLMPYTVYKFRVAWFFLDNFKFNQNNKQFEDLINIGFRKNSTTNLLPKMNNRTPPSTSVAQDALSDLTSLDEVEPIFSEESVEIRTLPYGVPSLPPRIEHCVSLSSTKLLITYRSPEFINGELISYSLNANLLSDNALQTNSAETAEHQVVRDLKVSENQPKSKAMNYVLSSLLPNSLYNISLSLINKEGAGPAASIQCKTLNANGKANYKQLFASSSRRTQLLDTRQIEIDPKLVLATKKLILNKKSTNYADSLEILFRLEDFHLGENFTSLAVHTAKGELFTADTAGNIRKIDLNGKFRKILSFNSQNSFGNLFPSNTPNLGKLIASGMLQVKISSLTIDWLNDKLYFVRRTTLSMPRNFKINKPDQRFNTYSDYNELIEILRSNLDGTDLQVVLRFDFGELPVKLKADPYNGFLFWSTINNYHNHAQLSRMMMDLDDDLSTPENDRLIEKFLVDQSLKSMPKLQTSIFRIDLALLNTNHTLSSARAKKIVQSTNDPYSLQFTINPSEFKVFYLKQTGASSSSIYSVNLDGSEPTDIRHAKVENSHFKVNLRNLAVFNRTFYWTLANETYSESFNHEESKFYHNMIYMDSKIGDLVGMELMHPALQQVPIPLNSIHGLQALLLNTDVKIKWQAPEILPETGLGAYRKWTYELCIMEMHSNYSSTGDSTNEDERFLRKRICFDIKDQFCNLGQLKMNTIYLIKVRAVSTAGPGPWSTLFTGRTLAENTLEGSAFKKIDYAIPQMLFATEDGLIRSNLIGDNTETLLQTNSIGKHYIRDIAWYKDEIFVSLSNTSIYRFKKNRWNLLSKVNGANVMAIDWLSPKLYFSNEVQQTISRCNLDGSQFETLPLFSNVKELVLDSVNALMYWSTGHSIEVATFNAIHKHKYYQGDYFSNKQIAGLTLDYATNKLYFYVQTRENSSLYSGDLLSAKQLLSGAFDTKLKLISALPAKSFNQGPLNYYSQKMFWLNEDHQVTITDNLGANPSTIGSLKNVHNLQLLHPSLQPVPASFVEDQQAVQPDAIDKSSIDINGSSNNFTISWQEVKNVNYGQVFYELILENRERIIELHLNQTSYTYPSSSENSELVLPVYKISIRAYTYWSYSKRTVIVLKFNSQIEHLNNIAPLHNKIIYLEPPKRPTILEVKRLDQNLYEISWTSSNMNHLNYLSNRAVDSQKVNSPVAKPSGQEENTILYCIFKKSITNDKWNLVYNGTDTKAKLQFESNELKRTNFIRLIAFNRFGESEPVNYDLNLSLEDLDHGSSVGMIIVLFVLGVLATIGIAGVIFYYWCKKMSEQYHEKKQLQFGNDKELAVLSNYPISIKKQNTNDNQLYQKVDPNFLANYQIPREKAEVKNFIGAGAFGDVYEGVYKHDDVVEKVAIKVLKDNSMKKQFLKEAQLMSTFKHENILQLKAVCLAHEPNFLVLEYMKNGDLVSYLRANRPVGAVPSPLSICDLMDISIQIANGCVYLEDLYYIHRDLAARNCLVNVDKDGRIVKIGDFGLTRDIYKADYYKAGGNALLPIRWMAPESLNQGKFSTQSDVWSFAVVLWEIFSLAQRPYRDRINDIIPAHVWSGGRLEKPDACPEELYDLMMRCWKLEPSERPSFRYCWQKLVEVKDIIQISLLNQQITCVHNQSYILNSGASNQTSVETMETTLSTAVAQPYTYNGGKKAGIVDVRTLSQIKQEDISRPFDNLRFINYDRPDRQCVSVNSYVNNNHLIEACALKDKDNYELPVGEKTYVI